MLITASDDLSKYVIQTDDPEIRARQCIIFRNILKADPELREELIKEGREQAWKEGREQGWKEGREQGWKEGRDRDFQEGLRQGLAPLFHVIGRKLGRRLDGDERELLVERLSCVGPNRLGDVVFDLDTAALAAWLADPAAQ